MNFQTSVKTNNKQINHDLKNWIKAKIFFRNASKTELRMFNPPKKWLDHVLKIKFIGKKFYQTDSVKYFGIHIYKSLCWKHHVNNIVIKLNKANEMLSKSWHYIDMKTLKSIFHAISELNLSYLSFAWAQNSSSLERLHLLSKNHSV